MPDGTAKGKTIRAPIPQLNRLLETRERYRRYRDHSALVPEEKPGEGQWLLDLATIGDAYLREQMRRYPPKKVPKLRG